MGKESRGGKPENPRSESCLGKTSAQQQEDQEQVLQALAQTFPKDLKDITPLFWWPTAALPPRAPRHTWPLTGYCGLIIPIRMSFWEPWKANPPKTRPWKPSRKSNAATVVLLPFLFVAGEHVANDILGDNPESWKSELLKQKAYHIEGITKGLGYQDGIVAIYLDHLAQAMKSL